MRIFQMTANGHFAGARARDWPLTPVEAVYGPGGDVGTRRLRYGVFIVEIVRALLATRSYVCQCQRRIGRHV